MKIKPDARAKISKNPMPSMHADKLFAQKLRRRKGQMWRQMCVFYLMHCTLDLCPLREVSTSLPFHRLPLIIITKINLANSWPVNGHPIWSQMSEEATN